LRHRGDADAIRKRIEYRPDLADLLDDLPADRSVESPAEEPAETTPPPSTEEAPEPAAPTRIAPPVHALAQARLRALVEDYPSKALEHFEYLKQRADMNEAQGDALDYGIAIALQRQGKYQEARKILLNLMDRGEHLAYEIQLADLDLASGHTAASLDRLAGLYHSFPGNNAISMEYSEALLHSGDKSQAETASVILRQQILNHDDDPALYALYARASNEAGDTIRA